MKQSLFVLIASIIAIIYGLAFLLVPVQFLTLYGLDLSQNHSAAFLARYCGSAFLGLAVTWLMARGGKSQQALLKVGLLGGLVIGITGLIVAVWDALTGTANQVIWINTVIYLFLGIGFGYYYFRK